MKNLTDMREWQNWNMQLTQNQSPLWIGGSNPLSRTKIEQSQLEFCKNSALAPLAQLVEHWTSWVRPMVGQRIKVRILYPCLNPDVPSSILGWGTIFYDR